MRVIAILVAVGLCACSNENRSAAIPTTPTPTAGTPPAALPTPAARPARVQGIVLDFQSAKPIAGVIVGFSASLGSAGIAETAVSDANGRYSLLEPPFGRYSFVVDNQMVGSGYPRSTTYRADIAVDKGFCVARYGMVLDSKTYLPIAGATARNLSDVVRATTGADGWYHIDWGCGGGSVGFNTTWHMMSRPNYNSNTFASGRGISGVFREDVLLTPR